MGLRTLYIGETNPEDTNHYYTLDESARNLYIGNYKTALEEKPAGVFYTSLSDFGNRVGSRVDILLQACLLFDKIIYRPPAVWTKDIIRRQTEELLEYIMLIKPLTESGKNVIDGYDDIFARSVDRKTEEPQLWVSGCSFSEAVGVEDEQRWATLLADKLNIPLTVLAIGGTGNTHQARKLLSADIRENDIVIFQITVPERETIFHPAHGQIYVNSTSFEMISDLYKLYPPDRLDELTLVINQMRDMQNVVNFLQKTKARFLFWSPGAGLPMGSYLIEYFQHKEYFYLYPGSVVDLGTDNNHPGPKTHKQYAEFVFEKLKLQEEQV